MGIAALGCRVEVVMPLSESSSRNHLELQVVKAEAITVATVFNIKIDSEFQPQRQLYLYITSKMSVEREKDKSKVHKLSLKGTEFGPKFRANLTSCRIL
jgi:hypothetical protein